MVKGAFNMKNMLASAISFAAEKHNGQFDKGGMPYILHPLKVMHYLNTDDLELMCIAVLHDVVEDCNVKFADLRALGFSERIIEGVMALTKFPGESNGEYMWRIKDNPDAIVVKLCDLRHNSDIRRLKGVTLIDAARLDKYSNMYIELKECIK